MELSMMHVDNERSPFRAPNGTSPGDFKAVAPVRISQACDRCRIKKAKCDGGNPCGRCHISDSLCVFGEKIKANRTVYPKGYVEMLERQQTQLVAGLQALYRKLTSNEPWNGERLPEYDNRPRTQDILAALGLVQLQRPKNADSHVEEFQEHLIGTGDDDTDGDVITTTLNTENRPPTTYDHSDPVQIDAWAPSFEAELAELMEAGKHDCDQENEAAFLQSLEATLPVAAPSRPDIVPQDCMSMNFVDPLLYRTEWMLGDEVYDLGSSFPPLTLPAHLQPFEFNVDPTTLSTKETYSRWGQTM